MSSELYLNVHKKHVFIKLPLGNWEVLPFKSALSFRNCLMREKCSRTELFLVRISLYSDWIWRSWKLKFCNWKIAFTLPVRAKSFLIAKDRYVTFRTCIPNHVRLLGRTIHFTVSDKHFVEKFVTEVLLGLKVIDKSSYKLLTLRNMLIPRKWLHTHHSTTNISHYSF